MKTQDMITYTKSLLQNAVTTNDWEAASRYIWVLHILQQDLILEQSIIILNLKGAA